jgi:hypothetical protein
MPGAHGIGIDLDSQFSRQQLVAFEPRFVYSDRLNMYKTEIFESPLNLHSYLLQGHLRLES